LYKNCGRWKRFDCIFGFSVKSYVRNTINLSCAKNLLTSVTDRHCVTHHSPLNFLSNLSSRKTRNSAQSSDNYVYLSLNVLIILYTGRIRRNVCSNSLEFRHWPKCAVFVLNCTAAVTAVQWYTDSEALLKLIKPTL